MRRPLLALAALLACGPARRPGKIDVKPDPVHDPALLRAGEDEDWGEGPPVDLDDPAGADRPFIKLAKRGLALSVHWSTPPPSPGYREQLERALAKRLRAAYRTEVDTSSADGAFARFTPAQYVRWVEAPVDDAVAVELEAAEPQRWRARVRVFALTDERALLDFTAEAAQAPGPRGSLPIVDQIWLRLTSTWTDPGAAPALIPLRVGDRLAGRGACDEALRVYRRVLPALRPSKVAEIEPYDNAQNRMKACREVVSRREAIERDKRAVFSVRLEQSGVSDPIRAAVEAAYGKMRFARLLEPLTSKPALVSVRPGQLGVELRHHPERYARSVAGRPVLELGQPYFSLDLYRPLLEALFELRARAITELDPLERPALNEMSGTLRLTKLLDQYLEVDFAERGDRLILADALRVKVDGHPETTVRATSRELLRDYDFLLGPAADVSGAPTEYGLVLKFLELPLRSGETAGEE